MAKAVSRASGTRCVCYCSDCQAFARFCGREGILDGWGGTDIWQMSPAGLDVEIEGNALRCVRLKDKGLFRWYCGECKTPLANTMTASMPFAGIVHTFMDHASTGMSREDVLGPGQPVQTDAAYGEGAPKQKASALFNVLLRTMTKVLGWKITGKGKVSPFFDAKTGAPKAEPKVLTPEEREKLKNPV